MLLRRHFAAARFGRWTVVRRIHSGTLAPAIFSVAVHVIAALVTIGGFIIHVYMGTALVRGSFTSIIRGEVSPEWAKTHHRLWYEHVTGDKSGRK